MIGGAKYQNGGTIKMSSRALVYMEYLEQVKFKPKSR